MGGNRYGVGEEERVNRLHDASQEDPEDGGFSELSHNAVRAAMLVVSTSLATTASVASHSITFISLF